MTEINREIFKDILTTSEETIKDLKILVDKSKDFFKIEDPSGSVILSGNYKLSNTEKISLLLIGKFFAQKIGFITSFAMPLKQISKELIIKETTLTWPLGELIKNGKIEKISEGYRINPYRINSILDELVKRYKIK